MMNTPNSIIGPDNNLKKIHTTPETFFYHDVTINIIPSAVKFSSDWLEGDD